MITVAERPLDGPLAEALEAPGPAGGVVSAFWLGQAGFVLQAGGVRVVVDPYLSDSLAVKYAGKELPHRRMMPPPIAPGALGGVALVLCTHRHTDHMDPGTLPPLLAASPAALVGAPAAERTRALEAGIPEARLRPLDAGERLVLPGVTVDVLPSAHEELTTDAQGRHHFLGYVIRLGGVALYHSGDCVPYPGQAERLRALGVDVALLPVNGRDAFRKSRGVPGNFRLEEAVALCRDAGVEVLVGHHHGLFDFNTVDPAEAERRLFELGPPPRALLARASASLELVPAC